MKHLTRSLGLISLLGLLLAGCQTAPSVTRTGSDGEVYVQGRLQAGLEVDGIFNADGTLDRSQFLGAFFPQTQLKLMDLRSAPTESGFIEVQATVKNTSRSRERIEYRFRWLDARGMEVSPGTSGWRSETIETQEDRMLRGISREPGIRSFQLFIRTYQPKK